MLSGVGMILFTKGPELDRKKDKRFIGREKGNGCG